MSPIPKLAIQVEPIGDRVVVLPLEPEQVTASCLVIPDTARGEKPDTGTIIALGKGGVGEDCPNPSDFLAVGDTVLFPKYSDAEVKLKTEDGRDVKVRILRLDTILGKIL